MFTVLALDDGYFLRLLGIGHLSRRLGSRLITAKEGVLDEKS